LTQIATACETGEVRSSVPMAIVGRTYLERGKPVVVLIQ